MKRIILLPAIITILIAMSFILPQTPQGAWHRQEGTLEEVLIFQDGYFSYTAFDKANRKFIETRGGTFSIHGNHAHTNTEFNTADKESIGRSVNYDFNIRDGNLSFPVNGRTGEWKRLDDGNGELAGNWRITGRLNNGSIQEMQRGARKTLKLLSGTRFQWMAINPETKEFFGTGGGTYSFTNGKYTENIEFFSRDSSRIGASLSFEGSVEANKWTHKGKNSRGEPLHEVWTREK